MKICQVHPGCGIPVPPPSWGAIEKIVWEFTCNLRDQGHQVDIKYVNEINPGDYDIVHCHVANLSNQLHEKGIPYIYQLHDHHAFHYGKDSGVYLENLKASANSLAALMPARFLVDYFDTDKAEYFSHGVNTKEFYPIKKEKPTEPKLLMLANNGLAGNSEFDRKGFSYGIALAQKLNLPITVAGPRNNENFFNSHLWTLGYDKLNIVFDLPNTELLNLYHQHDIFIHPSMLEAGHPNLTILEAVSAGLPIIGWIEMETTFHGLWRSPRNVFEMERGYYDIIENWESYRNRCLVTSNYLDWFNRTKELVKVYERYIN